MPPALARGGGGARLPVGRLPGDLHGGYGYPVELAAGVAVAAVREAIARCESVELVRFCLFDESALRCFEAALADGG